MKKNRIEWKNVRIVPILHNRMEFALEVRRQFSELRPDHVAIEYSSTLRDKIIKGIKRLPLLSVVYYEEADETFIYLVLEPTDGQVEAIRLAIENDVPVHFVDRDTEGYPLDHSPMPDPYSITKIGHFLFCQAYLHTHRDNLRSPEDRLREKTMAYNLQQLSKKEGKVLFVGGLYHLPGLLDMLGQPQTEVIGRKQRAGVGLAHLHKESSREIMTEMPYLAAKYERFRSHGGKEPPNRLKINNELIKIARKNYWKNDKEELTRSQVNVLHKFARNYGLISGALAPSFFQFIVAARGAADDNFAYEVWDMGSDYPWQDEDPGMQVLRLSGEDLFLDQKRIRFHRQLKTFRRRLIPVPVKKKRREKTPGEWKKNFKGFFICSYPP